MAARPPASKSQEIRTGNLSHLEWYYCVKVFGGVYTVNGKIFVRKYS